MLMLTAPVIDEIAVASSRAKPTTQLSLLSVSCSGYIDVCFWFLGRNSVDSRKIHFRVGGFLCSVCSEGFFVLFVLRCLGLNPGSHMHYAGAPPLNQTPVLIFFFFFSLFPGTGD